jgi:TetR/AcrR family transcriptional regulator, transcriptional repressor for nem operon
MVPHRQEKRPLDCHFGFVDTDWYLWAVMRNPDQTKLKILNKSGVLFNTQGYKATSISDITSATGLTKGAIYRHFVNKQQLEKETLFHLSSFMFAKLRGKIKEEKTAGKKLRAIFQYFESYITKPEVKGGCPLLNAAIEADDAHPVLRKEALKVLNILRDSVAGILENGKRFNQVHKDVDVQEFSTLVIASLEGAIMMSKLSGNDNDIRRIIRFLERQLASIEI